MKFFLFLLPVVLAAPEKRMVIPDLIHNLHLDSITAPAGKRFVIDTLEHMFHLDTLKCDIQIMLDVLGSDPTEHACEDECAKVILAGNVLENGCPLICQGFSLLVHKLHITPGSADCTATTNPQVPVGKRAVSDLLHLLHLDTVLQLDALKCDIQIMLDALGSVPTENACEAECHKLIQEGHVLDAGCPLICQGFSKLVHQLHVTPGTSDCTATAPAGKRFVIDTLEQMFHLDTLKCDIQIMLDVLGSDPTEHACEDECAKVILAGNVLENGCPLICQGFSLLVHKLHITPGSADCTATTNPQVPVGKRAVSDLLHLLHLDTVLQLDALKCDIQIMLDALGSVPTENACEAECHKLIQEGHVLDAGCPLICQGFSKLVHQLHVTPGTSDCTATAPAGKRDMQ